jgi:ubiquinone/menaquinone biosynthesis C-methylase UbiE
VPASAHIVACLYNWTVPLEDEALRLALDLADVQPGEHVLDVATGTGAVLRELARRGVNPAHVIGVDRSRSMLSGAEGLEFAQHLVLADARTLPFPNASFDVIIVSYLLHLLRSQERASVLDAARLALRQGGRVVTVTVDSQDPLLRWLLGFIPAWTGLRRLDARQELELAGLRPVQALYGTTRWPSLCVLARRD